MVSKNTETANCLNNIEADAGEDPLHVRAGGGIPGRMGEYSSKKILILLS